jgi:hypothetical protein
MADLFRHKSRYFWECPACYWWTIYNPDDPLPGDDEFWEHGIERHGADHGIPSR